MKKLFYLLLALPLVFAACEPVTPTPEDPNDQENTGNNGNENEENNLPTVTAIDFVGNYYTPDFLGKDTYLYYFMLSDKQIPGGDEVTPNASYFMFSLYSKDFNGGVIPNGTYTYDKTSSCNAGTFDAELSYGFKVNADGSGPAETYLYYEATVTVTDGKIEAEITTENGDKFIVVYKGDLTLSAYSEGGGDGYSTLTGDLQLNITDMQIQAANYADYYGTTDANNWYIQAANPAGKYITLDLLTDANIADCSASYSIITETDYINSFMPGYIKEYDGEQYILGCWYCELDAEGYIGDVMAPFVGGTFEIKVNGSTATITLNCVDDAGNKITGTISGSYQEVEPEASALSAEKRAHRVAIR